MQVTNPRLAGPYQLLLLPSQRLLSLAASFADGSSHELGCLPQLACLAASHCLLLRLPAQPYTLVLDTPCEQLMAKMQNGMECSYPARHAHVQTKLTSSVLILGQVDQ